MPRVKPFGALLFAVCAFAASVAPAAFAAAGGRPGGNAGCAEHQPPPLPSEGCH